MPGSRNNAKWNTKGGKLVEQQWCYYSRYCDSYKHTNLIISKISKQKKDEEKHTKANHNFIHAHNQRKNLKRARRKITKKQKSE